MRRFAISDLHLSLAKPKAMDIFGDNWRGHWEKIARDWQSRVGPEDAVLIAGDISWAMNYEEFAPDLAAVKAMPGKKLFIKGNHDYWHGSLNKTRQLMGEDCLFLQNDAALLGEVAVAGGRGWKQPGDAGFTEEDAKIYKRELIRARLSLDCAKKLGGDILFMTHYPPFQGNRQPTEYTALMEEYGVRTVVYGHIHGQGPGRAPYSDFSMNGVEYLLTSCDYLDFQLRELG